MVLCIPIQRSEVRECEERFKGVQLPGRRLSPCELAEEGADG